jgi:outer membrane protein assembly factor BamB
MRNVISSLLLCCLASCSPSQPEKSESGRQPADVKNRPKQALPTEEAKPGAWQRAKPSRDGADWPRFLGPAGDGTATEKAMRTDWPQNGLKKLWECPVGAGYAPPSVVDGKLLHLDAYGSTARLTCRNAETGEFIWKHDYEFKYQDLYGYDDGPRCCPVIENDRVYTYGVEGTLHCINFQTGEDLWKFDTKEKQFFHQNFFGVGSTPVLEAGLCWIAVGGSNKGPRPVDLREAKSNGSALIALDKLTGALKYTLGDDLASYTTPFVTTIHGKRVGLYFARANLIAFDPVIGKQLWVYPWRAKIEESVNAGNPVVVGDRIILSECYGPGTVCLKVKPDLSGVEEVWSDKFKDREDRSLACHWNTPIHHEGFLYASSGRHTPEGDIRCVSLETGEVKWREKRTTRCTFLKIDGHLLSLGENGIVRLLKLDPSKYSEVAKWDAGEEIDFPSWAPPVVSRGLLYLRGKSRLICYELIPKK